MKLKLNNCFYNIFKDEEELKNQEIEIVINLSENGIMKLNEDNIDSEKYQNKDDLIYRQMVDKARLAIESCSRFRNLPKDKYEIWQKFKVKFKNEEKP